MKRFFIPFILLGLCLPLAAMALVQPVVGDLTRIGMLPERAFGWNAPQPPVWAVTGNTEPNQAKILIIGDSFSWIGRWQSTAFDRNESFTTMAFGQVCSDIGAYLRKIRMAPDIVVIQTIERMFAERFFTPCEASRLRPPLDNAKAPTSTRRATDILEGSFSAKYALGGLFYLAFPGPQHRKGDAGGVDVRPVPDGCKLFSHSDCNHALFLGDDSNRPALPLTEFKSPLISYLKAAGIKTIFVMPIPNKTSVYFQPTAEARRSDAYLEEFARHNGVQAIKLYEDFTHSRERYRDFYFANDTHLSNEGFAVLGKKVGEIVRNGASGYSAAAPAPSAINGVER